MTKHKTLRTKTYVLLALMASFGSVGDIALSHGMKALGQPPGWSVAALVPFFVRAFSSGTIWVGIALLLLFFFSYVLVLSWADFSYVSPASAIGYVLVAVMAYFFLGEHIPAVRWWGVGLICVGVFLVGGTHPNTGQSA